MKLIIYCIPIAFLVSQNIYATDFQKPWMCQFASNGDSWRWEGGGYNEAGPDLALTDDKPTYVGNIYAEKGGVCATIEKSPEDGKVLLTLYVADAPNGLPTIQNLLHGGCAIKQPGGITVNRFQQYEKPGDWVGVTFRHISFGRAIIAFYLPIKEHRKPTLAKYKEICLEIGKQLSIKRDIDPRSGSISNGTN